MIHCPTRLGGCLLCAHACAYVRRFRPSHARARMTRQSPLCRLSELIIVCVRARRGRRSQYPSHGGRWMGFIHTMWHIMIRAATTVMMAPHPNPLTRYTGAKTTNNNNKNALATRHRARHSSSPPNLRRPRIMRDIILISYRARAFVSPLAARRYHQTCILCGRYNGRRTFRSHHYRRQGRRSKHILDLAESARGCLALCCAHIAILK